MLMNGKKKQLVGAKETSYVPIWLTKDQLHIAHNHLTSVLEHELVHVVAKDFGNLLFDGSWNITLIEGLAEAVTQGASRHSTLNRAGSRSTRSSIGRNDPAIIQPMGVLF